MTIGELLSVLSRLRADDHVAVRAPEGAILVVTSWEPDDGGGVILNAERPA